jgi:glycosyltransferase involved in cell wall biosynthesis
MTISIIIPWMDRGDPVRAAVFEYVRAYYESLSVGEVVVGTYPDDGALLNRSRLRNEGANTAKGDVFFFCDADILVPRDQILMACSQSAYGGVTFPYSLFRTNCDPDTVDQVLRGENWEQFVDLTLPPYLKDQEPLPEEWHVGPAFAISRREFFRLDGFDEGFVGWGEEDKDFLIRARDKIGAVQFVPGGLLHLGQPPSPKDFPGEYANNRVRYLRKRRPVKIAVYAPAKNEESNVVEWAASARDADEIVLVDTGSSDRTIATAAESAVVVRQAVITPWRFDDGFNAALSQVSEDIDIAVPLHLDERLAPGWRGELERAWYNGGNRFTFQYRWADGTSFTHDRIHARHGYRWIFPAHEMPVGPGPQVSTGVVIHHQHSPRDRATDRALIHLMLKEHPDDPRAQYYSGREHFYAGEWIESRSMLNKYLSNPKATFDQERSEACRFIAKMVWEEAKEAWLLRACSEAPQRREVWADLAQHYWETGQMVQAQGCAERALSITEPTDQNSFLLEDWAWNDDHFRSMVVEEMIP